MEAGAQGLLVPAFEMLGVSVEELIEDTIMGMREAADEIGLKGSI